MDLINYPKPNKVNFKYEFVGQTYEAPDITELVRIDEGRLAEELSVMPTHTAYWAAVAAYCSGKVQRAKTDFDLFCAQQESLIRKNLGTGDGKTKVTEKSIEAELVKNAVYQNWKTAILNLELEYAYVLAVGNALRTKLTALTTISGLRRSDAEAHRAAVPAGN